MSKKTHINWPLIMSERQIFFEQTWNKILKVDLNNLQDCMNKNWKGHTLNHVSA